MAFEYKTGLECIPMHSTLVQLPSLTSLHPAGLHVELDLLALLQHLQQLQLGNQTYDLPSSLGGLASLTSLNMYDVALDCQLSVLVTLSNLQQGACIQPTTEGSLTYDEEQTNAFCWAVAHLVQLTDLVLSRVWHAFDGSMMQTLTRLQSFELYTEQVLLQSLQIPAGCHSLLALELDIGQMPSTPSLMHLTALIYLA